MYWFITKIQIRFFFCTGLVIWWFSLHFPSKLLCSLGPSLWVWLGLGMVNKALKHLLIFLSILVEICNCWFVFKTNYRTNFCSRLIANSSATLHNDQLSAVEWILYVQYNPTPTHDLFIPSIQQRLHPYLWGGYLFADCYWWPWMYVNRKESKLYVIGVGGFTTCTMTWHCGMFIIYR